MEDMLVPDLRSENIVAPANLPPPEVGVNPQHQYWPLPPAGQAYWWTYLWSDGNYYPCTGPLPAGVVGLAAQNLNDGAFRSNRPLFSICLISAAWATQLRNDWMVCSVCRQCIPSLANTGVTEKRLTTATTSVT